MNEETEYLTKRNRLTELIAPRIEEVVGYLEASVIANDLFERLVESAIGPVLDVLCADAEEELQLSDEISDQLFRLSSELSCRHGHKPSAARRVQGGCD
jgi:hypothetical protein